MRLVLFDDPAAAKLRPLTWLRPASSLLIGTETTEARWRRLEPGAAFRIACRPLLAPFGPDRVPLGDALNQADVDDLWVSDLVVPHAALAARIGALPPDHLLWGPDGALLAFRPGPASLPSLRAGLPAPGAGDPWTVETLAEPVDRLAGLADLIRFHEARLVPDLEDLLSRDRSPAEIGDGRAYGQERIRVGADGSIDHGAVLDARTGPIVLGNRCRVFPHTWIRGPFFAADDCLLLGGKVGGTSLGPACRVRGEVEASVFLAWSNKAHDGFVGHSYLGEWVNLGAMTTTSDLKNNYAPISLETADGFASSGLIKLGVFFGDHVKTRIGSLITCGTILGVGANLIGDPVVGERNVRDFSWGSGPEATTYDIDRFLGTAAVVFGRRGVPWSGEIERLLRAVHAATQGSGRPPSEGTDAAAPGGRRGR